MLNPDSIFFITGGGNGIGKATAELAVNKGHSVVIADINQDAAEEAAVLSFAELTLQPETVAEAVFRAAENEQKEILIPPGKGFFSRFVGIFPGFLNSALGSQWERGKAKMMERVASNSS